MPNFLTIKEAMAATGKSRGAIRSIIEPIRDSNAHPDKEHLRTTQIGAAVAWQLSEELLFRHYPKKQPKRSPEGEGTARDPDTTTLLTMLQNQLNVKDQQLAKKDDQIKDLTEANKQLGERLHESQALQLGMQRRIGMGPERQGSEATDGEIDASPPASTSAKAEEAKQKAIRRTRKHWWQRLGAKV